MTTTHDIVAAARGWIGTRFHHQGRLKKTDKHAGGVDCLGLLVGVASELNLRSADGQPLLDFDRPDYPHYPDSTHLMAQLETLMQRIPMVGMQAGDVAVFTIDESPRHLAIISDDERNSLQMIHAYAPARAVVEHALDAWWQAKIKAVYRIS